MKDERLRKDFIMIATTFQDLIYICNGKIKLSSGINGSI